MIFVGRNSPQLNPRNSHRAPHASMRTPLTTNADRVARGGGMGGAPAPAVESPAADIARWGRENAHALCWAGTLIVAANFPSNPRPPSPPAAPSRKNGYARASASFSNNSRRKLRNRPCACANVADTITM